MRAAEPARGFLTPQEVDDQFRLARYAPPPDLAPFVQRFWLVEWNVRDPMRQENLPYPCVNIVFEPGMARVYGVATGKGVRLLHGKGRIFGVKFRPGAFYPLLGSPVCDLTNRSLPLEAIFGVDSGALEADVLRAHDVEAMIAHCAAFLRTRLPALDETITGITTVVDVVAADRSITKVEQVTRRFAMSKRTLQRVFRQYVGVSPKWVIQRYRLHEAAEQVKDGAVVDWPKVAQELGYFDQAHFIKDFKRLVGHTPAEFAAIARETA